jgi:hypothetical protein
MLVESTTAHVHILQSLIINFWKAGSLTYLRNIRIIEKLRIKTRDIIIDRCKNIILGIIRRLMANNSNERNMIIKRIEITYMKIFDI